MREKGGVGARSKRGEESRKVSVGMEKREELQRGRQEWRESSTEVGRGKSRLKREQVPAESHHLARGGSGATAIGSSKLKAIEIACGSKDDGWKCRSSEREIKENSCLECQLVRESLAQEDCRRRLHSDCQRASWKMRSIKRLQGVSNITHDVGQ